MTWVVNYTHIDTHTDIHESRESRTYLEGETPRGEQSQQVYQLVIY